MEGKHFVLESNEEFEGWAPRSGQASGAEFWPFARYGKTVPNRPIIDMFAQRDNHARASSLAISMALDENDVDEEFTTIETKSAKSTKMMRAAAKTRNTKPFQNSTQRTTGQILNASGSNFRRQTPRQVADAALQIPADWTSLNSIQFSALQQVAIDSLPAAKEVTAVGSLYALKDTILKKARSKQPQTLNAHPNGNVVKPRKYVRVSEDPVMNKIEADVKQEFVAARAAGARLRKTVIFTSDDIVATLMTASRSVYPWDVTFTRRGPFVYLDKREGSLAGYNWVNETASDGDTKTLLESVSPLSLAEDNEFLSDMFLLNILNGAAPALKVEDELELETGCAPVGYRYRRFALNADFDVVIRCEVHGVNGQNSFFSCVLNEVDPARTMWARTIKSSPISPLMSEVRNNGCRLARACTQALLGGCTDIHIGFVTSTAGEDISKQTSTLLYNESMQVTSLASMLNLNTVGLWGVLLRLLQCVVEGPKAGEFVMGRDPTKSALFLYQTPTEITSQKK